MLNKSQIQDIIMDETARKLLSARIEQLEAENKDLKTELRTLIASAKFAAERLEKIL